MTVRFLRTSESPHVSVFYLSATSLSVSLCATLIPTALGYKGHIRMPHGWVEWGFMLGVGVLFPSVRTMLAACWPLGA